MAKLYVCGEALIDFVPCENTDGTPAFAPKTGGSPYNAARAAAVAGADVSFIGALSSDIFGEQLEAGLKKVGVDCSKAFRSDDPTMLAFVDFTTGSPRYAFYNDGTIARNMMPDPTLIDAKPYDILDVGSIALVDKPCAEHVAHLCQTLSGKMRIALDPNARPTVTNDKQDWLQRIAHISSMAHIIKVSDEDLAYMHPNQSFEDYAHTVLKGTTELVIITLGEKGACAFTETAYAEIPAPKIELADTVGAGDALMGAILAWVLEECSDEQNEMHALSEERLKELLNFSITGAAINCTRIGAVPATKAEILEHIARQS